MIVIVFELNEIFIYLTDNLNDVFILVIFRMISNLSYGFEIINYNQVFPTAI